MTNSRICSIDGCDKPKRKRGWCLAHYHRWWTHGDPLGGGTSRNATDKFIAELIASASTLGDECVIWPFARRKDGRGDIKGGIASRAVCERFNGPPPTKRHEAAHECGKGHLGCVNPNHLTWKTPKENHADTKRHGTATQGERSFHAKLNTNSVLAIRELSGTLKQYEIATRFGVSKAAISAIVRRKRWAHLP